MKMTEEEIIAERVASRINGDCHAAVFGDSASEDGRLTKGGWDKEYVLVEDHDDLMTWITVNSDEVVSCCYNFRVGAIIIFKGGAYYIRCITNVVSDKGKTFFKADILRANAKK